MTLMSMIIENRYSRIFHHLNIKDIKTDNEPQPKERKYVDPDVVDVQKSNWRDSISYD